MTPLSIALAEADYLAAMRLSARMDRRRLLIALGLSAALAGLAALMVRPPTTPLMGAIGWMLLVAIPGAWIGRLATLRLLMPGRLARQLRRIPELTRPMEVAWTDEVFAVKSEGQVMRLPWSGFPRWREGDDMFLLYSTRRIFHVIPKRAFADAAAIDAFRELLRARIHP